MKQNNLLTLCYHGDKVGRLTQLLFRIINHNP
jgi:hypothetical protein